MSTCMCNWVTMLYSRIKDCIGEITIKKNKIKKLNIKRKFTEHCKPNIMEKNHFKKRIILQILQTKLESLILFFHVENLYFEKGHKIPFGVPNTEVKILLSSSGCVRFSPTVWPQS